MVIFTKSQRLIVRELIRNPRISDNQIAKNTGIPVMTVNRKRKALENIGVVRYYAEVDLGQDGLDIAHARQLYIIRFRSGITREQFMDKFMKERFDQKMSSGHIVYSALGEKEGYLSLLMIIEAKSQRELVEIFNGEIIQYIKKRYGNDAVVRVTTTMLNEDIRHFRNYLPKLNMEDGRISKDWPDEKIFVDGE